MKNSSKRISVSDFLKRWKKQLYLEALNDSRTDNRFITGWKIEIPDLTGPHFTRGHIHLITEDTVPDINSLSGSEQKRLSKLIIDNQVPCIVFQNKTNEADSKIFSDLKDTLPLLRTGLGKEDFLILAEKLLRDELAYFSTLHGVLIDIHRLGVLILGKSGVGKSESALDLINRGSKLIADDVIEVRKDGSRLVGKGPENIRHLMEIRGVGIVNIRDLYGASSVMNERQIDLVIELDHWDQQKEYDRLGFDTLKYNIMGTEIPYMLIPVSPGRNTSTIIDVAVRNQLLKSSQYFEGYSDTIKPGTTQETDI